MKRLTFVSAGTVVAVLVSLVMGGTSAAVEGGTTATAVLPSTSTADSLPTAFLALGLLAAAAGFALIQRRRAL